MSIEAEEHNVIEMKNITKKFGSFVANDKINLSVKKGEVHALLGENGAGKSTLMNQLYGLYHPTFGEIYIQGKHVNVTNPNIAIAHGIGMVHQHFMLVEPFTVTQNIILGKEICSHFGILNIKKAEQEINELSKKYGLHVDPKAKIQDISVGQQQRVEILKALYRGAEILILDEPTAVLTPQEIEELIGIIRELTKSGKTIIIITHKLKEIKAIADRCTIIRRGVKIDTVNVKDISEHGLAEKMVGREVSFHVEKKPFDPKEVALSIKNVSVLDSRKLEVVKSLSLEVRRGEILGIAGIDGNGQSELIEALTGLRKITSGSISVLGKQVVFPKKQTEPRKVFLSGLSSIPEDRQKRGLVLDFTVAENMIIQNYGKKPFSSFGILNLKEIKKFAKKLVEQFDVRPANEDYITKDLSGGNQQKVIIAREVYNNPEVLVASQPTRGLDVGAIEFVHKSLVEQRDNGKAVLLVSFELDEILDLSDRIAVIYEGKIVGILDVKDADEKKLGLMMAGGTHE